MTFAKLFLALIERQSNALIVVCRTLWGLSCYHNAGITNLSFFPICLHNIPRIFSRMSAVSASRASMSVMISSGARSAAASGALGFLTDRS